MSTTVFARAGALTDQVRAEARQLDPVKVLVTVLLVVPFIAGWVAARIVGLAWRVLAVGWTAAVVGWRSARGEDLP